ncbi:hypothetical protein IC617_17600 [Neiella sp. HB171785]|uniref:Uncharacterized protein n=1 Tax=Neiella litorisoli TaxID=2771431 RepID=A0A8J6UMY5_9GAMM|nr:PliI family lysozyme inhibitor of I-type lysozyme [Neiella litorisoli]MBD1391245.1 hypothetical protein [Neiella litorisoli]
MKQLFLSVIGLLSLKANAGTEIIQHQFKTEITTDIYVRTGAGEHSCGGTASISAFYYGFDEYIDAVIFGRGGPVAETWVIDSDKNNNPEVFVWVRSCGSGGLGAIHAYELLTYDDENIRRSRRKIKWVEVQIPPVPPAFLERHRGHDTFDVLPDGLIRTFPQYNASDSNAAPTKEPLTIKYLFKDKKWVISETVQ